MINKKEIKILVPIILVLGIFIYFSDPLKGPILPCIFNRLTGYYCPGCGMSRAVHYLLHFNFKEAIKYNVLIFIIPPLLAVYYYLKSKHHNKQAKKLIIIILIITLVYGVLRNLSALI
ncbi:MAG TPA: DUF2752 domain-containing protein [Eubacteriaceae bacterium]|nr:DUF2752 domain-containing protein [Eubacteriaceae bacterium]